MTTWVVGQLEKSAPWTRGSRPSSAHHTVSPLFRQPADNRCQFLDLVPLLVEIPCRERIRNAVLHMVFQDLLLDPVQSSSDSLDLREDVDAIGVLVDHARDSPHLTLDPDRKSTRLNSSH